MQSRAIHSPVERKGRQGFLPIETNAFDRYFISLLVFVAVHLAWMRWLEPEPLAWPLWIATVLCLALGVVIVRKG